MNKKTRLAYRLVFLAPKQYININIYGYSLKKKKLKDLYSAEGRSYECPIRINTKPV